MISRCITLKRGDITKLEVDAIVNAANTSLLGGGGVDGAIHRAGGRAILEECRKIGGCKTGEAVITTGGNLPAKYVIHAVGPVWSANNAENADALLASAYLNSLKVAIDNGITSIAFPNISTGIYGFPKERAAEIALDTVLDYNPPHSTIKEVVFICFDDENYRLYSEMLK